MRAFLFLVVVFQIMFGRGIILGSNVEQLQEIKLIRRAYLDVAGLVPTAEEVEWYVVYNDKGYNLAVNHLLNKYSSNFPKEYLLSDIYKHQPVRRLSDEEINKNLLYVVGLLDGNEITPLKVETAKRRLIDQSLLYSNASDDVIDYICNALMSRSSNVQENNLLSHKFKEASETKNEAQAWIVVINEILNLPDVRYK